MEEEMRFIKYIKPVIKEGTYQVTARQEVSAPQSCEFTETSKFSVTGNAFGVKQEEIFSVFPCADESGEFENVLPFVVMEQRTFPWERSICPDRNGMPVPWVALLVVSDKEGAEEKEIPIADLFEKKEEGIFFPEKEKLPSVFAEKKTELCHVLDLPRALYQEIMPTADDLPYLCHARSMNLHKTEDSICEKDGFFSVICANRFVPSGETEPIKSTIHLVSLLGFGDLTDVPDCRMVRLVSLYRFQIFSQKQNEENFASVIERLKKNCGVINSTMDTELKKEGFSIKKHFTRTGEPTWSLYRSPLIPFKNTETMDTGEKYTADGHMIYDKEKGIFDVTYCAAWQMGRMITVSRPAMMEKIMQERKTQKLEAHQSYIRENMNGKSIDVESVMNALLQEERLEKGESYEKSCNEADKESGGAAVFRGYC